MLDNVEDIQGKLLGNTLGREIVNLDLAIDISDEIFTHIKLIFRKNPKNDLCLYDLEHDPLELSNISEQNPDIIKNLEKKFSQINPTGNFEFKKTQEVSEEENKKLEDELRKLGYI